MEARGGRALALHPAVTTAASAAVHTMRTTMRTWLSPGAARFPLSFGRTGRGSTRGAILLAALSVPTIVSAQESPLKELCGVVVKAACDGDAGETVLTLLLEPGIALD